MCYLPGQFKQYRWYQKPLEPIINISLLGKTLVFNIPIRPSTGLLSDYNEMNLSVCEE